MRTLLRIALCGCLLAWVAPAQHGGGGARGGGGGGARIGGGGGGGAHIGGGGFSGGNSFRGGSGYTGGGYSRGGGYYGGGSYRGTGYHGGYYGGHYGGYYGGYRGYYGWGGYYYPWLYASFGYSGWPGYYDYPYGYGYGYDPGYSYAYPANYPAQAYQPASNVTVVYPQQPAQTSVYVERAEPALHEYDEYGQEVRRAAPLQPAQPSPAAVPAASPLYLIAFRNGEIRAAAAYWVNQNTLHYVTLEHVEKQSPLDAVDRDLSLRLNRERRVTFSLTPAR